MKRKSPKRVMKKCPHQSAREAIGILTPDCSIIGVTKGQFSLLDLIRAVAAQTGQAALSVSTWSTGIRDTQNMNILINKKAFTSVTLCLDRSFSGRQPQYVKEVIKVWGEGNVRMTRNHAKFFMLRNDEWNICVRSSMNLNHNPRMEQFDLDDNKELCDFFQGIVDEIFEKMPPGLTKKVGICDQVFPGLMEDNLCKQTISDIDISEDPFADLEIDIESVDISGLEEQLKLF